MKEKEKMKNEKHRKGEKRKWTFENWKNGKIHILSKNIVYKNLVCTITFTLQFSWVSGYLKRSNEIQTFIYIFIGL